MHKFMHISGLIFEKREFAQIRKLTRMLATKGPAD